MGEELLKESIKNRAGSGKRGFGVPWLPPGETVSEEKQRLRSFIDEDLEREMKSGRAGKDEEQKKRYRSLRDRAVSGLLPSPQIMIAPAVL